MPEIKPFAMGRTAPSLPWYQVIIYIINQSILSDTHESQEAEYSRGVIRLPGAHPRLSGACWRLPSTRWWVSSAGTATHTVFYNPIFPVVCFILISISSWYYQHLCTSLCFHPGPMWMSTATDGRPSSTPLKFLGRVKMALMASQVKGTKMINRCCPYPINH